MEVTTYSEGGLGVKLDSAGVVTVDVVLDYGGVVRGEGVDVSLQQAGGL